MQNWSSVWLTTSSEPLPPTACGLQGHWVRESAKVVLLWLNCCVSSLVLDYLKEKHPHLSVSLSNIKHNHNNPRHRTRDAVGGTAALSTTPQQVDRRGFESKLLLVSHQRNRVPGQHPRIHKPPPPVRSSPGTDTVRGERGAPHTAAGPGEAAPAPQTLWGYRPCRDKRLRLASSIRDRPCLTPAQ